ncbi:TetR family transcriptional regulator C-terminal domain-containing protein [Shinella sp. G-2]|uniref:TetR family transcriptional regulator C-terminal domain-containing protein n=1 Tax=Shinella sp. G-2 TaxID=3133141 RepID=UPI003D0358DA
MDEFGKFKRQPPEDRRQALIEATLVCLGREGHAGLSVRKISAEAGISIGLINHHYANKDALVGHAYEHLALGLLETVRTQVAAAGPDPRARLSACFQGIFSSAALDRATLRTWVVFWGMIDHSQAINEAHDRTYAVYRTLLETLLGDIHADRKGPRIDARLAAIGLSAMLDGLWLELSLNPTTFARDEAITLCESWVDALCAGAMPRLLVAAAPAKTED